MNPILVEAECITDTAVDMEYYTAGKTYTIDMVWAKKRDIWRYFRPLREVSEKEAEDRIHDEILPAQERIDRARAEANEEAEAKLAEEKPEPVKSYPAPPPRPNSKPKAKGQSIGNKIGKKARVLGSQIGRKAK